MAVTVVGAGLAGAEAAWQLSKRGVCVTLLEMKPEKMTKAHSYAGFAELVCSNSLRASALSNAAGLLKQEMRELGSLIMQAADATAVPAGGALAVDRTAFSDYITRALKSRGNIEIIQKEAAGVPATGRVIIATGPLTSDALIGSITGLTGECPYFYDAAAPIVRADSIDMSAVFEASRYGKGGGGYLNCPMDKERYDAFYDALVSAECAKVHGFEEKDVFEGCMPVESMARRGRDTLRYGPLKPVGLIDPATGKRPYAVVQLRREDNEGRLYNMVGFQTRLKFPEQKRVFSMISALHNAEFVRLGVMHRNTYINSPKALNRFYQLKADERIYFAGQITGVEGYIESASSGLLAGIFAACAELGQSLPVFGDETAIGALPIYISSCSADSFEPMNINFGIMKAPETKLKDKTKQREEISKRALKSIEKMKSVYPVLEG